MIGILFWDHAGAITGANDVFLRIVGYSREDLASGKLQWRKMTPPEFQSLDEAALQEVATKGACEHYEKEFLRKDGSRVPIVIGGASFGGSSGEGVAFVLDITARKQAEAVGAVRARQHAVVAELGRLALTDVTLQRLLDRAVAQVADAFGVEYCKVLELQPSGEELKLVAGVGWQEGLVGRATVGAGLDSQAGFTLISRDPIVVDDLRTDSRFNGPALLTDHGVVSGLSVIIGEVERPFGVLGVHTRRHRTFAPEDLDFLQSVGNLLAESVQRKKMESSLRRSEERYREIVNQSPTGILVHIDGLVVFVNEAYCHLVGASSAEELLGTAVLERFNSEYHTAIRDRIENIVRTDETTPPMDSELVRIDGSLLDVTTAGTLINFQGALAVQVMVQDVTDRKRAERALRKSEQRFREVAESIDDVIWIRELDDPAAFYHSPAFEKVWGRSSASVRAVRDSWLNTIHPDDRTALRHAAEVKQERGDYDETYRIMRPDGAMRWIHDRAYPVRDAAGKVVRIVGIAKDITARRKLEEQLRQSQKMEAVGQLAGGVAHDFNNMLTVIIGHLALLRADPQVTPKTANALAEVATAANRAAKLTSQLLTFSRRQVMTTSTLDLNKVVTDLMPMLRRMLGEAVELQFDSAAEALAFNGDVNLMEQVLVNLAINARDAMPGGGTLRITAQGLTRVPPATDGSEPATGPANFVRLSVGDTGAGIPEEIRSKIFEPFFTTKDVGKGTGLGLATVFGIVQQHRGWIELESELGRGSTFHVYLPRLAIAAATKTTEPSARPAKGGSEVVLLVEDEPMVQEICMLALTQFGYQVFAASNGMEALKVWAQHEDEIDLLLTDMVMPNGISGTQLARRMLAEKPALKVIYSSGYSAEIAGKDVSLKEGLNFLSKPFELDRLLRTVRATLDGKSSRDPFVEKD